MTARSLAFALCCVLPLPPGGEGPPAAPASRIVVPAGAEWRYHDLGTDPGPTWMAPGFDDSGWPSGPAQLGFGDGDEATVVQGGPAGARWTTIYFRHTFPVDDAEAGLAASLRVLADDGAQVFLNGIEIARWNVENGAIGHTTWAAWPVSGVDETLFHAFAVPAGALRGGDNVLAVAVHQADPGSGDLSFDAELVLDPAAASLVRGPYLQDVTPTGVVVRWRTDVPTATRLWLGTAPGNVAPAFTDPTPTTEHVAPIGGLAAETGYAYAVGDATGPLAGPDAAHVLRTLPPTGAVRPLRVWVLGDFGRGGLVECGVRELFRLFAGARPADALLFLGDDAYDTGTDAEYQNGLFEPYREFLRSTPSWSAFGNHDAFHSASATQSGPYYDGFTLPRSGEAGGVPSGTEAYYSFDRGHVHFVCLDSTDSDRSANGVMANWLRADLAANTAHWTIAFFHHPPYSAGSHVSDSLADSGGRMTDVRQNLLPILEAGGVDLVLCGHSHDYERSFLLDGHYGTSSTLAPGMVFDRGDGDAAGDGSYGKDHSGPAAHAGTVYVVAGSAGGLGGGALNHPVHCRSLNHIGSFVCDVDGDRLDGWFVGLYGVEDHFVIEKGRPRSLRRDQPAVGLAAGGRQDLHLAAGPAHAGRTYLLAGAFGTSPGFVLQGVAVPLNQDAWFQLSLGLANSAVYPQSLGVLDGNGAATAAVVLPPGLDPALAGLALYHAYVVVDASGAPVHASDPVKLTLRP